MEALEGLLNSLKKREFKSFEEANAQLEEVIKLRDAVIAFEKESLMKIVPATFAKTQQFVASAKSDLKKLEADASGLVNRTLDGLYSDVKSPIANATLMHSHSRYTEASEALAKARAGLAALDVVPYNVAQAVKTFLNDSRVQVDTLEKKIADSMMSKVVNEKVREVDSHGTKAKDMHFHSRYQESLDALAKAREGIALLSEAPYNTHSSVTAFLPDFIKQINDIEAKVGESMMSKVVNEKIREADSHGTKAKDMHFHSRYQESLDAIAKAREGIALLSEAPYNTHSSVTTFLPDFIKQIDDIEAKVSESMLAKVVNEKIREADSHGTKAKDMHFHSRYQESLDAIAKARESISELQSTFGSFKTVVEFLPAFIAQINEYEKKCGESMYGRVVNEKIREADSHGTKAKDMHFHSRYQESLDAIAKARESISELSSTPFNTFPAVVAFLPDFIKQIDEYERLCGESMYGRVVNEKIREAESHGTKAKDMHFHSRYQESLDAIAKARESISELQSTFGSFKTVVEFLPAFIAQIDEYEKKCGESMYGRVVNEKIREAESHGTKAKDMHFHSRYQESLDAVAKARESIAELSAAPFNTFPAVVAFLPQFTKQIDDYERQCGEALFSKVVDEKIREAESHGTKAKDMHFHSRYQESLDAIAKARELIGELKEAPYGTLKATKEFLPGFEKQIDQYERQCGEALFGRVVNDKIYAGKSHVTNAKNLADHSRYEEALDALTKAYESLSELENPPYNDLPLVKTYVTETRAALSTLESSLTAALGSKARVVTSSTNETTTPVVTSSVPNAPGFPNGPVQSTVGPWVLHINSPLSNVQALPTTPAQTRSFVIKWNTSILTINSAWKKSVNELIRTAQVAEVVPLDAKARCYDPPSYIEGKWSHTLSLVVDMLKQVNELPDDEVKTTMLEQLNKAKAQIEENDARNTLVAQFVHVLAKASQLHHHISYESESPIRNDILAFVDAAASEWHSLNIKFPYIPPFQEKIDKMIKEQEHVGKVDMIIEIIEGMVQRVDSKVPIHKQEHIVSGLKKLEKWPVAHRAAIRRLQKIWNSYFRFFRERWQPEFEPEWPTPTAPTDLWQPSEEDVGIPDYEMIRPGTPTQSGLPFANRPDSTKDPIFSEYTLPLAGKIVFANDTIQPQIKNKEALKTKFSLTDPIFARAVWPRSIANYAIGKKKDGTPVHPIDGLMDKDYLAPSLVMSLVLKIDGKPVHGKHAFQDSFGYFDGNNNMYYTQQTVGFGILGLPNTPESFYTGWDLMPRVLYGHLLRAGAGTHKVEISLHYNIFDRFVTHQKRRDGPTNINTLTSHPLAEGSFEIEVPAGAKMPDTLGPNTTELVPLNEISNYFRSHTEHLLWCKQEEDWQIRIEAQEILEHDKFRNVMVKTKVPAKWGKAYACLTYKNPEENNKWFQESITYYLVIVIAGPNKVWSQGVEFVSVFRQGAQFEADFLPDSLIAKIPNRCEPKFRNV